MLVCMCNKIRNPYFRVLLVIPQQHMLRSSYVKEVRDSPVVQMSCLQQCLPRNVPVFAMFTRQSTNFIQHAAIHTNCLAVCFRSMGERSCWSNSNFVQIFSEPQEHTCALRLKQFHAPCQVEIRLNDKGKQCPAISGRPFSTSHIYVIWGC